MDIRQMVLITLSLVGGIFFASYKSNKTPKQQKLIWVLNKPKIVT